MEVKYALAEVIEDVVEEDSDSVVEVSAFEVAKDLALEGTVLLAVISLDDSAYIVVNGPLVMYKVASVVDRTVLLVIILLDDKA